MSGLGFTAGWVLWGLVALPLLWWLLRAVPPAPVRRRFPGIALLLGLRERDPESQRTPWWLLVLRVLAMAAVLGALSGPVLNPRPAAQGEGPLLVLIDGGWASARDWPRRVEQASRALADAGRDGRLAAVALLDDPSSNAEFRAATDWIQRLPGLEPRPWSPIDTLPDWLEALPADTQTLWISDGLARDSRAALHDRLSALGPVRIVQPDTPILALMPAGFEGDNVTIAARRPEGGAQDHVVLAIGRDPAGNERELARAPLVFSDGALEATASFDLLPEVRNRITRFQIDGARGTGAVSLTDDSLSRRKVALLSVREGNEALALLSPLHYLRQALEPSADLVESASLGDLLLTGPDVLVLADQPGLTADETAALIDWVEAGGLLLRFAGPRLAGAGASTALGSTLDATDPLLPVPLRAGGRTVGGAMSWGDPRSLGPFPEGSPFAGLAIPEDVGIRAQVLAQPGPDLAARTIAALADGTPLVTRDLRGAGQIVLFHVTANAEWSNLPLSGLFVGMLERLAISARSARSGSVEGLAGTRWQPQDLLAADGSLHPTQDLPAVDGALLADVLGGSRAPGPDLPPGLYAGPSHRLAINATGPQTLLMPAEWPAGVVVETGADIPEQPLAGYLWVLAAGLLMIDALATLALGGRLLRAAALALVLPMAAQPADAQPTDARLLEATEAVVLASVATGDPRIDEVALAGLRGLSNVLFLRTSVEPAPPMLVDVETDELALFPFLYWPVTPDAPLPSSDAYARLNRYLRSGGMILFDTRDADTAQLTGGLTAAGRQLQRIAAGLDIPPLEPLPADHVLTRTFYLLGEFPGRWQGATLWVEAAPPDAAQAEGMPFRTLNDGVTPVVIGAHDWAAAWAVDDTGAPMVPIGRGAAGERQRELALRFGINLIMHVLSGNYKSDQVHVPALLERLGQ